MTEDKNNTACPFDEEESAFGTYAVFDEDSFNVAPKAEAAAPPAEPKRSKRWLWIVIALVLIAIIAAVAIFV